VTSRRDEELAQLARLQRFIAEHPGEPVGYDPGVKVLCPGRRLIKTHERRATPRQEQAERRSPTRPCGYQWGRGGLNTAVHARMVRDDLGKRVLDPSLGPPPPIRAPSAFLTCPDCKCEIEFVFFLPEGWHDPQP
jgi:hypothetical protein